LAYHRIVTRCAAAGLREDYSILRRNGKVSNKEPIMAHIYSYGTALAVFLLLDMVWLGTMASRFYRPIMGDIALAKANLLPAAAFYLLYPLGLVIFAIAPALKGGGWQSALLMGGLFGLFTYGAYDLTNQATLRNWTINLTLVDMAWGGLLGALTAAAAFAVTNRFAG
jgi:uncharacterized membrane protein